MKFVSAFDSYNLCLTGNVGRTLATPSGGLNEHIPIIIMNDQGGGVMNVSDSDDGSMYTLNTIKQHSVCYGVDCRNLYMNNEIRGTLQAMNEDGDVVVEKKQVFHVDSIGHDIRSTQFSRGGCCDTLTSSDYKDPLIVCYDARGNVAMGVAPTITGDHENRITDYTSVVVIDHSRRHSYQPLDIFPMMEAHMGTGGGNVPLVLIRNEEDESISNDNRSIMCEQPSGELHGSGCVQRYAPSVQEDK